MTVTPPPSMPCKCRLIRPDGIQRVYFRAESVEDAQRRACRILKKKSLPKGWKLIVDGKAAACYPRPAAPEPLPTDLCPHCNHAWNTHKADGEGAPVCMMAPRPFKAGDRVRGMTGCTGPVMEGVVCRVDDSGDVHFTVEGDPTRRWAKPANLTLVEPAPQPKAEEFKPGDPVQVVKGCQLPVGTRGIILGPADDNGGFRCRWNGGHGILWAHAAQLEHVPQNAGPDYQEQLAAIRQATGIPASEQPDLVGAVRSIASQMDRHRHERDEARLEAARNRERAEAAERDARACAQERDIATAKLDDLSALHRVMSMAKASTVEDWDFTTLMADVLARG